MFCSISGVVPERPVISKFGHVYEKSLIEKHIQINEKCPVTGEDLTVNDLTEIKVNPTIKPRPATATSLPSLLKLFQNEWDAILLESYNLKKQLESTRQELAQSLYQHDAALRVIARLVSERDEAIKALEAAQASAAQVTSAGSEKMDVEATGLTEEVKEKITATSTELSAYRKSRKVSPTALEAKISEYKELSSNPTHKASQPGILCLDIHPQDDNKILTGGADQTAVIFNKSTSKIEATLVGHSKKVLDVLFSASDVVFTASQDKTARIWRNTGTEYKTAHVIKSHTKDVSQISLHPSGDYLVTGSLDGTWAFHDINSGRNYVQIQDPAGTAQDSPIGVTSVLHHPDGLILGTGTTEGLVRIWDVKTQQNIATFKGHKGRIVDLAFSENGFFMATASEDASVKMWDLRKLKNFHTLTIEEGEYSISSINFDFSGTYLVVGGNDIRVYTPKTLSQVVVLKDHKQLVTDAKFGQDAQYIASVSMDRNLKFFGL